MSSSSSSPPLPSPADFLRSQPFRLSDIVVSGNSRTETDFLVGEFRELNQTSQTFGSVIDSLSAAEQRLHSYGIFESVSLELDQTPESPAAGILKLKVKEKKMLYGGKLQANQTSLGESEVEFNGLVRNAFGRAERFELRSNHGAAASQAFSFGVAKPRFLNIKELTGSVSIFNATQNFSSFASHKERAHGINCSVSNASGSELTLESAWRELFPAQRKLTPSEQSLADSGSATGYPGPSIRVFDDCRPSVKNSIKYSFTRNSLDHPAIPTRGNKYSLMGELAGIGGDTKFVKVQADGKSVFPITDSLSLSASILGGFIRPFGGQRNNLMNDRFFFGQPMSMRGFDSNTVGPRADADFVGGDLLAASTIALNFALPSQALKEIGVRGHVFANAGNLVSVYQPNGNPSSPPLGLRSAFSSLWQSVRCSVGMGLIFPIANFRLEVNLSQPIAKQPGDITRPFQFGIGIDFA